VRRLSPDGVWRPVAPKVPSTALKPQRPAQRNVEGNAGLLDLTTDDHRWLVPALATFGVTLTPDQHELVGRWLQGRRVVEGGRAL